MAAVRRFRMVWMHWRHQWVAGHAAQALWWSCRRILRMAARRAGLGGALVLTLLVLALATLWMSMWQRADLLAMQRSVSVVSDSVRSVDSAAEAPPVPDRQQMVRFIEGLPAANDTPGVVQSLLTLASQFGLVLPKGSYQFQVTDASTVARYRMVLPVQGSATQVRRFMSAALKSHPSLAMEGLQLTRDQATSPAVEARIEWVLYTRPSLTPELPGEAP